MKKAKKIHETRQRIGAAIHPSHRQSLKELGEATQAVGADSPYSLTEDQMVNLSSRVAQWDAPDSLGPARLGNSRHVYRLCSARALANNAGIRW